MPGKSRRLPGMSIREYVAYRKRKGLKATPGGIHYWIKKGPENGGIKLNAHGRINPLQADEVLPCPSTPNAMTIRDYVDHRREMGLPASNRSVYERIRLGYILRTDGGRINAEQADFMWFMYRHNVRCSAQCLEKWYAYLNDKWRGMLHRRY
jgi:hypothetical protein